MMLCECGCGRKTKLAKQTVTALGWVKGKPIRFINGHQSPASRAGARSSHWKGNEVGYHGAHKRVRKLRGKAAKCEICGREDAGIRYQWANLTGRYSDPMDYKQMCPSCHKKRDVSRERRKEISEIGNHAILSNPAIRQKMSLSARNRKKLKVADGIGEQD